MKLTKRQLYDYRDPTRAEMLLTSAIHHLFRLNRIAVRTGHGEVASEEALETLFQAKREVKAEIKRKASEEFAKWRPARA